MKIQMLFLYFIDFRIYFFLLKRKEFEIEIVLYAVTFLFYVKIVEIFKIY